MRHLLLLLLLVCSPGAYCPAWAQTPGEAAGEVPAKGELVLAPGWGGRVRIADNDRGVDVGDVDKPRTVALSVTLPPGRYRVVLMDEGNHPIAFTDVVLALGSRLVVSGSALHGLALPPPPPVPGQGANRPRVEPYPRGLAARPLTLRARDVDVFIGLNGRFNGDDHQLGDIPWGIYGGLTDRLESRNLGLYYAILKRDGFIPALGLGAGLTGAGSNELLGFTLQLSGWLDIKEHLGDRTALQASLRYDTTIFTGVGEAVHHTAPSLHLLVDAASMFSLTAGLIYDWTQIPTGDPNFPTLAGERLDLAGGFHLSPASWLDLRGTLGPSWARLDGGDWVMAARWTAEVHVRF